MAVGSPWETVRDRAAQPDRSGRGLWARLEERIALDHYRPEPAGGVEVSHLTGREGDYHVLKNTQTKSYYRLSERDYFLWQRIDGTRTVKDLVVAYFLEYNAFAFGRVAALVEGLKSHLMLAEQPIDVYHHVRSRLDRRRLSVRLNEIWHAFLHVRITVEGLDHLIDRIYRRAGWVLFTRPLQILFLVLSVAGVVLFTRLFGTNAYSLVTVRGSYRLGVTSLVMVNIASIFIHEMSHALTVKHYGRELRRGGFMLYFGLPAFFMDTTDIWMEGKRARLAVTWAGPYSGLILGGLASAVITIWPDFALRAVLFQFAFFCYVTVFVNLNPLLELDGYFILMDLLEIPMLRQRSLAFVRQGLWQRLSGGWDTGQRGRDVLASFSREDRIFTVFGALSALWTAYTIVLAVRLWRQRLAGPIGDLWAQGGVGEILLSVVLGAIGLLFVVSLAAALVRAVRRSVRWLASRGLFADTRVVAFIVLMAALVISVGPGYLGYSGLLPLFGLLALVAAAILGARNARNYAGSRFAIPIWLFTLCSSMLLLQLGLTLGRGVTEAILPAEHLGLLPIILSITLGLGHVAYVSLLAAGLILFADTHLRELPLAEKVLLAGGLVASCGVALLIVQRSRATGVSGARLSLDVSAATSPLLTVTLLLPTLLSSWETSFGPAWGMISLALGVYTGGAVFGWPSLVAYPLLAAGLLLHHLACTLASWPEERPEAELELRDEVRLERAFCWTASAVFGQFRHIAGQRQARLVAERFNTYARAAGWQLGLVDGRMKDSVLKEEGLIDRGARYADALSLLLDMVAREVGEKLTARGLQRAYDGLPWEEREVGAQYLFRDVKRAEVLSREFEATRQDHRWLLRRIPLFATMEETEIDLLISHLRVERCAPGKVIIRQGDSGDTLYIITSGYVEVSQRDERGVSEVVNRLGRGECFGELALLHDAPRNATCRAKVPTELLCLSCSDFDRLVRSRFTLREKVGRSIARVGLLCRMPLFAEMDAHQIRLIAGRLQEKAYDKGTVIIRQGEIGDTFYVIESGKVRVSVEENGERETVTERGVGEYVGEIALLLEVPRTATVTALTPVKVLALHKDDFNRLMRHHLYASRGLDREISRRMIDLERAAVDRSLSSG